MFVDTGAAALILPAAWRDKLGSFPREEQVGLVLAVLANGEVVQGSACAPVEIQIEGFRPVVNEVMFVETEERSLQRGSARGPAPSHERTFAWLCDTGTSAGCRGPARPSTGAGAVHGHEVDAQSSTGSCATDVAALRDALGIAPTLADQPSPRRSPSPGPEPQRVWAGGAGLPDRRSSRRLDIPANMPAGSSRSVVQHRHGDHYPRLPSRERCRPGPRPEVRRARVVVHGVRLPRFGTRRVAIVLQTGTSQASTLSPRPRPSARGQNGRGLGRDEPCYFRRREREGNPREQRRTAT